MKIVNNNIRAAKRHICRLYRGSNGVSFRDFAYISEDSANRTHEKSQKRVNDNECNCPSESP